MSVVTIQYGSMKFDISITYKERKNLTVAVHPDGNIKVLAPIKNNEEEVIERVRLKAPWILKQISFFNLYKPKTPPRKYINGETHLYLGRQYRLKIERASHNSIKLYRGVLCIKAVDLSSEKLASQLRKWYKEKAQITFDEVLQDVLPMFKRYKTEKPEILIRSMAKRWGSCTVDGKIVLNLELIKAPKGSIEYVMIHELCHLIHHNHTKAFYDLQSKIMPDWEKWKEKLENALI